MRCAARRSLGVAVTLTATLLVGVEPSYAATGSVRVVGSEVIVTGTDSAELISIDTSRRAGVVEVVTSPGFLAGAGCVPEAGATRISCALPTGGGVVVEAGGGDDTVIGGAGGEVLDGGSGDDLVDGRAGNDSVGGGPGADRLLGGADDDTVDGGPGADVMQGDSDDPLVAGDDHLQAYDDVRDVVVCGPGADVAMVDEKDVVSSEDGCEELLVAPPGFVDSTPLLTGRVLRADRRLRRTVVVLGCVRGTTSCSGRLLLRSRGRTFGRADYVVPDDGTARVAVRLTRRARASLRHRSRVRVQVVAQDGSGTVVRRRYLLARRR